MPYYAAGGGAAPPPYGAAPYGGGQPQPSGPYGGAPPTYGGGGPAAYGGMPAAQPPPSSQGAPWGHDYYGMIQAQEMAELQRWFNTVDRDRNGSISASELQQQQWNGNRFSASTCRSLVKVFDRKQSGEITFAEYAQLHKFVSSMEAAFRKFDRDRNGRLDKLEITNALREGGFHFNPATANTLMRKFATTTGGGGATTGGSNTKRPAASATLNLESFIQLCAFLGSCRSTFQWTDSDRDGQVELTLAQFIGIAAAF